MIKIKATITNVKIYPVLDLWRRKPQNLKFDDTDVIIVTAKTKDKIIKESFYTCVKPDGTFNIKTANTISQARRERLANFIKHYFKVEDTADYNLKKRIKEWKGKRIELKKDFIYIP